MTFFLAALIIILVSIISFFLAKRKVLRLALAAKTKPHSLVHYYGWCAALWCGLSGIVALIATQVASGFQIASLSSGYHYLTLPLLVSLLAAALGIVTLHPTFKARHHLEKFGRLLLFSAAFISISITVMIIASVLVESCRFFAQVPLGSFLFGLTWSPQTAMRPDQVGSSGSFGAVPVFTGTLLITFIAMLVAVPLGLFAAIYLSEYASSRFRTLVKPVLEMLAGIPTVVYGYFAALVAAPHIRQAGEALHLTVASESALAAGLVMGVMVIPFILSLSDDVMNAVPNSLREASLALGATRAETVMKVIVPAALPGIMGAVLLAISRAVGETMIVTMAAGLAANLTFNPLSSVTTVTAQIVTLLVGDQEFDSPKTLAAFALGLLLFIVTLLLNVLALTIVKKYREQYE